MENIKSILCFYVLFILVSTGCKDSQNVEQIPIPESPDSTGFVLIDGTKLDFIVEGKGIPCLVIGSSIYYPRTFSKVLQDHFHLYFVDMRWFAKNYSPVNLSDFRLQTIIDDIEKVRSELKLEKVIIMGHSIHGAIAYEYAKQHPDKVSHLVMIDAPNTAGNIDQEVAISDLWNTASAERKDMQSKNWKILANMTNLTPAQLEIETYCLMSPEYWYNPTYDARWLWQGMALNTDILHYLYNTIFSNYHMFKDGLRVPVPTFLAQGRYDYVYPYTLWNGYDTIHGLTIKIFDKSGHTPQLEENGLFDTELLKWINENQ
jgi:proline iminopeptidase